MVDKQWFKRNPEITYILANLGVLILGFVLGVIIGLSGVNDDSLDSCFIILLGLVSLAITAWTIRTKNRSLWNIVSVLGLMSLSNNVGGVLGTFFLLSGILYPIIIENRSETSKYYRNYQDWKYKYQSVESLRKNTKAQQKDFEVWKKSQV